MSSDSFIKDIGRSFIVSSFIPAALFVLLGGIVFRGFLPVMLTEQFKLATQYLPGEAWLFIVVVPWVGFALYSGWNTTVRFYEGYYFPKFYSDLLVKRLTLVLYQKRKIIDRIVELKLKENLTDDESLEIVEKESLARDVYTSLSSDFPLNSKLLPTRLGNVLRSSETYAGERYGMEGVIFFPRLVHVFPQEYKNQLEEANNKFIFLLNSALLSGVIGTASFMIGVLGAVGYLTQIPCLVSDSIFFEKGFAKIFKVSFCLNDAASPLNFLQRGFNYLSPVEYLILGLALVVLSYSIYRVAVVSARAYTGLIRAGYDLYRFDLLKVMGQKLPEDIREEYQLWTNLTEFIASGHDLSPNAPLEICYPRNKETPEKSKIPQAYLNMVFKKGRFLNGRLWFD